jgi:RNA polymerase sigma-70 factor (ECF subfamily)
LHQAVCDRASWAHLLQRVARATGDRSNAEDHLHTAFVRLEEYRTHNGVQNPAAFLLRTAVNIAVDEHRHRRVRNEVETSVAHIHRVCDAAPLQDEALAIRERLGRVNEALMRMNARTREIFLMDRLSGMKHREIAAHFGVSVSAVEKHIAKAVLVLTGINSAF